MSEMSLPAVTMAVLGYNQEKTIGYAIDSALAQDYAGPLTLVFSDDCSQDGTFRIMQEKAAAYKGPHRIILNRNSRNLKYAGNLLKAMDLAPGDWQCKQDGDDYSAPDRIRLQVQALMDFPQGSCCSGRQKLVQVNSADCIPDLSTFAYAGTLSTRILQPGDAEHWYVGCVLMWKTGMLDRLRVPFLKHRGGGEDLLLGLMSCLYGDILWVERELLCYVRHGENFSCTSMANMCQSPRHFVRAAREWLQNGVANSGKLQELLAWLCAYIRDDGGIPSSRSAPVLAYIEGRLQLYRRSQRELAYAQRGFWGNCSHWLRERDAPVSWLLPPLFKATLVCLRWHLFHR